MRVAFLHGGTRPGSGHTYPEVVQKPLMEGTERNRAEREVILHPRDKPLASIEELTEACLPALAARLWGTCCWSPTMDGAWKLGDHNFLIAEVSPDPQTCLYIQFWSEPHERVCAEVCSGEWNPGALRYVRKAQRDRIEALGYTVGGRAGNFQKELTIENSAEAEAVAREVLGIFFDVFGYRGQWPLELNMHQGERATHRAVHSSVTRADVARLAVHLGLDVDACDTAKPLHLRRGRRRFIASVGGPGRGGAPSSIVMLQAALPSRHAIDDAMLERINDALLFARVSRATERALVLSMPLRFDGGVTADWMAKAFGHWFSAWRDCERLLKTTRAARPKDPTPNRSGGPTLH